MEESNNFLNKTCSYQNRHKVLKFIDETVSNKIIHLRDHLLLMVSQMNSVLAWTFHRFVKIISFCRKIQSHILQIFKSLHLSFRYTGGLRYADSISRKRGYNENESKLHWLSFDHRISFGEDIRWTPEYKGHECFWFCQSRRLWRR